MDGDKSQFDQAREYIAAEIERTGLPEHDVHVNIAGHHSADYRSISIGISAGLPADPTSAKEQDLVPLG